MKIHVNDNMAEHIRVFNLNTEKFIARCQWANQETGEYGVALTPEEMKLKGIFSEGFPIETREDNIVLVYKGE